MAITTKDFETRLFDWLERMEQWPRCHWCQCNDLQRRNTKNSELCDSCQCWRRKASTAEKWLEEHSDSFGTESYMHVEYNVEYAALCREEGQIGKWKGPVEPLDLEWELRSISERFCGEDVFGDTTPYFEQFSETQQRLLMFMFEELTKVWLRNRRRSFAIERVTQKLYKSTLPNRNR